MRLQETCNEVCILVLHMYSEWFETRTSFNTIVFDFALELAITSV
jgi:hypothetical protein